MMENWSNRRWENPLMSEHFECVEAIGTQRANSPLWPGINVCHLRGRIYVCCRAYPSSNRVL